MSYRKYLTDKRTKNIVNIDDTELEPTFHMTRGGKFRENYMKHLESMVYHDNEMVLSDFLLLMVITELIKDKRTPIYIQCNKRPRLVREVINVIGTFLDNNFDVLDRLHELYFGKVYPEDITIEEEEEV